MKLLILKCNSIIVPTITFKVYIKNIKLKKKKKKKKKRKKNKKKKKKKKKNQAFLVLLF